MVSRSGQYRGIPLFILKSLAKRAKGAGRPFLNPPRIEDRALRIERYMHLKNYAGGA